MGSEGDRPSPGGEAPATPAAHASVIEYSGNGAKVRDTRSTGATRRALQMVGNDAGIGVRNFAGEGRPLRLEVTEQVEFVDAPSHVKDLRRYRARSYGITGNRIAMVDRPMEVVEVHPLSVNRVEMAGVTVQYYPPAPAMGLSWGSAAGDGRYR